MKNSTYVIRKSVRLTPDAASWRLHDLRGHRSVAVTAQVAAVALSFARPSSAERVSERLSRMYDLDDSHVQAICERLVVDGWVVPGAQEAGLDRQRSEWASKGWSLAHEHHVASSNYPYEDYQAQGRGHDSLLMARYYDAEVDCDRFKEPNSTNELMPLPTAREALSTFTTPLPEALDGGGARAALTKTSLQAVSAAAFGPVGSRRGHDDRAAPTFLRTSPSGGARHPVEGYVWSSGVSDLEDGLYHHATGHDAWVPLGDVLPHDVSAWFPAAASRLPATRCVFLVSVIPARNMYRYREPRTLRTVFMDASHVATTIELLARAQGFETFGHHGVEHAPLRQALGAADSLEEAVLWGVALADEVTR